ncbi:MAG: ABC transporter ATP-binding protein [Clostridium sp.]|nr:ABC transporter ATP-binding protein [Clostridium sp.]MDY3828299.1 ABC transporter ATP-binding protein [Clostridium sp.]
MIEINNVTKTYDNIYKAVNNVNLKIPDGKIFGLLGPNGAGKTSIIKMITGIISPTVGDISINGISISDEPVEAKEQFGYVPDSPDIFLRLTGLEYLNFIGDIYDVSLEIRAARIRDLAEKFEMELDLNDKIQSYSHGMRQKIINMGVMLHRPKVWILDEPMTGLDPKSAYIVKEMMKEHAKGGNTVLFSTHVLEVAEKICDCVAIINKGKVIFEGTLEELRDEMKSNDSLEDMFLELTEL